MLSHFLLAVTMERQTVSAKPEHLMIPQQVVVKQVEQPQPVQTYIIAQPVYPVLRRGLFSRQITTSTSCSTGNCR
jgi:hypothetical protein